MRKNCLSVLIVCALLVSMPAKVLGNDLKISKETKVAFDGGDIKQAIALSKKLLNPILANQWVGQFRKHYFDKGDVETAIKWNDKEMNSVVKNQWVGKFRKYYFDKGDVETVIKWNDLEMNPVVKGQWQSRLD